MAAEDLRLPASGITQTPALVLYLLAVDGKQVDRFTTLARTRRAELGRLRWAARQGRTCEAVRRWTGLTVAAPQRRTVTNFLGLRHLAAGLPTAPALQGGQRADDLLRCLDLLDQARVDPTAEPLVGLGWVCRRQATLQIAEPVATLSDLGLRQRFGVKLSGLDVYGPVLVSADSRAWSDHACHRQAPSQPSCTHSHRGNCPQEAAAWLLRKVTPRVHPAVREPPWFASPRRDRGVQLPLLAGRTGGRRP
jgi:hypothetical protein